jgi:hypothetical protein
MERPFRVHEVVGVEHLLDVAHHVQDVVAELHAHRADLAHAHAVLAGAGAFQAQRALDQALVERLGELGLLGLRRVHQEHEVEVAVADVAEERHRRDVALHVLHGLVHALGEARNRHADVGRDGARAGPDLQAGEVASWRACQSWLRSSGFVAQTKSMPPCSFAIACTASACSTTEVFDP